jgi:hypothetical protein
MALAIPSSIIDLSIYRRVCGRSLCTFGSVLSPVDAWIHTCDSRVCVPNPLSLSPSLPLSLSPFLSLTHICLLFCSCRCRYIVVFVKSEKDRHWVAEVSGLPLWRTVLLSDLPKHAALPVGSVQVPLQSRRAELTTPPPVLL